MTSGRGTAFLLALFMVVGGFSMLSLTTAVADGTQATGATPGTELDRMLQLQNLTMTDLEANRAGRVSPHEVDIAKSRRSWVSTWLLVGFGCGFVVTLVLAAFNYVQKHKPIMFIVPGIVLVMGVIAWALYATLWRFPSDFADQKVVMVKTSLESLDYLPTRQTYTLRINGEKYQGFAKVRREMYTMTAKAYVIPDKKLVLALEPSE